MSAVVVALLGLYAAIALLPRPMARLQASNPNDAIVDFHSHTSASHDGRGDFSIEANRAWHRAAGFDVAYVTDHGSPSDGGFPPLVNPARSGDDTVLLRGLEVRDGGMHVIALSNAVAALEAPCDLRPAHRTLIGTIPDKLARLPLAGFAEFGVGVSALEFTDGAPRGLDQAHRDRALLQSLARTRHLVLVAGSNNHGWGRTSSSWNLVRLAGWRTQSPERVARRIESLLATGRSEDVHIIERRATPIPSSLAGLTFTIPSMLSTELRTLDSEERWVTITWTWLLAGLARGFARSAGRDKKSSPDVGEPKARPADDVPATAPPRTAA